ncbi:MAG: asparagine--tRNA ligase, partial [Euryarchaeota archaeon]|nr:asparagine--tRNA ligase [Euryarchaeota archaeon]
MSPVTAISRIFTDPRAEEEVVVRGWVYRTRTSGSIVFSVVRDSSGIVQVTVKKGSVPDGDFEAAVSASIESSVV